MTKKNIYIFNIVLYLNKYAINYFIKYIEEEYEIN